jgi:hypothetical protein
VWIGRFRCGSGEEGAVRDTERVVLAQLGHEGQSGPGDDHTFFARQPTLAPSAPAYLPRTVVREGTFQRLQPMTAGRVARQ